jgi:glycosyltransferase involved in cell wall biosynthesis
MGNNRILFYSSVKDVNLFNLTGFYLEDINALRSVGYEVLTTNKVFHFLFFWNYDISFFYFYKKSFVPALISLFFFKKILFTGGIDDLSPMVKVSYAKRLLFKILFVLNYIIADSCNIVSIDDLFNTSQILNWLCISTRKLKYFPHSISLNNFTITSNERKENIICTICWMDNISNVKRKGVDATVRIFKKIIETNTDFKLYIIGSGGDGMDYIKKIADNLQLNNSVFFTGAISEDEKINLLRKSKFYFQLSQYEGFGLAVIEAMALNCFIVHSGKGGLKDTIGDNGYIVDETKETDSVVLDLLKISSDYYRYESLLNSNSRKVDHLFSSSTRANNFKSVIDEI